MVDKCNKCRISPRVAGDSWCIGCSAWESVGRLLTSKWEGPAGLKSIADNLVVDCARQVHALRSLGAGHRPASNPAGVAVKEEVQDKSEGPSKSTPGLAAKSKAVPQGDLDEYSYTDGEESEESPQAERQDHRPSLPRHRAPPPEVSRDKGVTEAEALRDVKAEEKRESRGYPGSREHKDPKRKRDRSKEKGRRKKEERSDKKKRRRRGGRKHQQLGRLLEDPYRPQSPKTIR